MEALLSLSFDNISSKDVTKIRKGLRQIEGLLAQICLANSRPAHRRKTSVIDDVDTGQSRSLSQVAVDPAFREFFRLQEGFEWNGTPLTGHCQDDVAHSCYSCNQIDLLCGAIARNAQQ